MDTLNAESFFTSLTLQINTALKSNAHTTRPYNSIINDIGKHYACLPLMSTYATFRKIYKGIGRLKDAAEHHEGSNFGLIAKKLRTIQTILEIYQPESKYESLIFTSEVGTHIAKRFPSDSKIATIQSLSCLMTLYGRNKKQCYADVAAWMNLNQVSVLNLGLLREQEKEIIPKITNLQMVCCDFTKKSPLWIQAFITEYQNIKALRLHRRERPIIRATANLPQLKTLHLAFDSFKDSDITTLSKCKSLTKLTLEACPQIRDQSIALVSQLRLKSLHLKKINIAHIGEYLKNLTRLKKLHLDSLCLSEKSIETLVELTTLNHLAINLYHNHHTSKSIQNAASCPALKRLVIDYIEIDEQALELLSKHKGLTELQYRGDPTKKFCKKIANISTLTKLQISSFQIAHKAIIDLSKLPLLRTLTLFDFVLDRAFALPANLNALRKLKLTHIDFEPEWWQMISQCPNLKVIFLQKLNIWLPKNASTKPPQSLKSIFLTNVKVAKGVEEWLSTWGQLKLQNKEFSAWYQNPKSPS